MERHTELLDRPPHKTKAVVVEKECELPERRGLELVVTHAEGIRRLTRAEGFPPTARMSLSARGSLGEGAAKHTRDTSPTPASTSNDDRWASCYRAEAIAMTARAAHTARTPAKPVKIAAIASRGTAIPIAPSTISF